jgi:hypothetical protein
LKNRNAVLAVMGMMALGFVAGMLVEPRIERVLAQSVASWPFPAVPGPEGGEDIT